MQVGFEIIRYFRLVKVRTLEDLETVRKIILNDLSDDEFLVVFYLGLDSSWGINLNKKGELSYCERPKKYLSSWVAWYLGYSKERIRQIIANIECKVYNAFYDTNFSYNEFLSYIAERRRIEDEILKEKIITRYHELRSQKEKGIKTKLLNEFNVSKDKLNRVLSALTPTLKTLKI